MDDSDGIGSAILLYIILYQIQNDFEILLTLIYEQSFNSDS